jgi:hypothetical protein
MASVSRDVANKDNCYIETLDADEKLEMYG